MKPAYLRGPLVWCLAVAPMALSGCALTGGGDRSLSAGQRAPDFSLKRLNDESKKVHLASFRGEKPVVLFFGSYT